MTVIIGSDVDGNKVHCHTWPLWKPMKEYFL